MNPDLVLGVLATLAGFLLKTALAFGVCLVIDWLAVSPARRFIVWLSFLSGTAAYWLWLASDILASARVSASASGVTVQQITSTAGTLPVPGSWFFPFSIALRAMGAAYLVAAGYILFNHLKEQWKLRWVLSFTTRPPAEIEEIFQPLAMSLHLRRPRLLVLSGITSPATFGWLRPVILLPAICLWQDRSELEDILRHELHHIRRWDFVWNGVAILCRAFVFFHPATWYAVRRMQFNRELACDLAVVSDSRERRAQYAECLIHFARLNASQDPQAWGIDFATSSKHLKARVRLILTGSRSMSRSLIALRLLCGLILVIGFLGVVPSLAVYFSYEHQGVPEPRASRPVLAAKSALATGVVQRRAKTYRLPVSQPLSGGSPATVNPESEVIPPIQNSQPQIASGPQLLHRSSPGDSPAARNSTQQQTVSLADDSDVGGGVSKSGDKREDVKQAVTAAAGIARRLGNVDRH